MVPASSLVCDVGTDHGYLPVFLVSEGICEGAYALDLRKGPLSHAKQNVAEAGLSDKIELFISDGLDALARRIASGEAKNPDVITITGMGGPLMEDILSRGRSVARQAKRLILSPQSHVADFRQFLCDESYGIVDEKMVYEDGKYYFLMEVEPLVSDDGIGVFPKANQDGSLIHIKLSEAQLRYGPILLARRDETLISFLHFEKDRLNAIRSRLEGSSGPRLSEIDKELSIIEKCL